MPLLSYILDLTGKVMAKISNTVTDRQRRNPRKPKEVAFQETACKRKVFNDRRLLNNRMEKYQDKE